MSYAAFETSRHSGAPVELFKFNIAFGNTEILVWEEDFADYANTAALLAVWDTEQDPNGTGTWTLDNTRAYVGTQCLRFSRNGDTEAGWVFSRSRLVTGRTLNTLHYLRRKVYRTGTIAPGVPVNIWDDEETAVTSDASGNVAVAMTFSISGASTGTQANKWFDRVRLYERIGGQTTYSYTSDGLSHTFRGDTYEPAIFSHTPFEYGGGEVVNGEIELTMPRDHAIAKLVRGGLPVSPISCTIYQVHRPDIAAGTSYRTPFIGQITNSKVKGAECVITLATARSLLDRKRPSVRCQKPCNWMLYDERCQLNKADFAYTSGTITAINGRVVTISGLADEAGSDFTKFQFGYLVNQAGESCFIQAQDSRSGNDDVTLLAAPSTLEVGQNITVHWGCDRTTGATGCGRFNNILHFGGFPKIATRNLYIGAGIQP